MEMLSLRSSMTVVYYMNLLEQTQYLIKKTGLKPDKLKGQNFCIDEELLKEIVKAADVSGKDTVLEVGAGFGFLTTELLKKAKKVIAVEMDSKLVKVLKQLEKFNDNLEIIEGDILQIPRNKFQVTKKSQIPNLKFQNYKIVANLPYSITSTFLKKFLTGELKPESMTLLIQKEVAQRICARAGQMSLLALSVQLYAQPKIIRFVSKNSFWPKPKVDSAILQIDKIGGFPYQSQVEEQKFWQVLKIGFSAKRKTLENNLANGFYLPKEKARQIIVQAGLKPISRAQELSLAEWLRLAKSFNF